MSLTIGICAFNEERNIRALLQDVLTQRGVPESIQVIVVASGCTDKTPTIVREIARDDERVQLVEEKFRSGKTNAINRILAMCSSEFLVLIDADIRLPEDCVSEVLRGFSDETIGVVGALPAVGNYDDGMIAGSASIVWRLMRRTLSELSVGGVLSFVMGEVYCFRTSLIRRIPDGVVNDDAYVASHARSQGFGVILAPAANFVVRVPSSVSDYVAQRRRVTYGHLQIRAQTGKFASSIEGIALYHPRLFVRALLQEAASRPTSTIRALLILQLEFITRLLAWLDFRFRRQHMMWKQIGTTK